jgi:hypothetical protein
MRVLLVISLFLLTNCATIVSDSSYPVTIQSSLDDVEVEVRNGRGAIIYKGSTPVTIELESGKGYFSKHVYTVRAYREGYRDSFQRITTSLDGWYLGNLLLGGLIGAFLVDPITGAMWEVDQQVINVELRAK